MDPREILRAKRDGGRLASASIQAFMEGYVDGSIGDEHASALLATIFQLGLDTDELVDWTRAMLESGERLEWSNLDGPVVDKHSTGGVGDKVSIPLAPALAACGAFVPMISGRGLGHTGGTLDKLESVPGLSTELSPADFAQQVRSIGFAFSAQSTSMVPADKKLYALRDAVGLVESMPLIASSILSKKLAEGIDALVLDVKFGSGAFLVDPRDGEALARTMIDLARGFGLSASVFQTSMERPLGRTVGHALEMTESFDCLAGGGPPDLRELVTRFGGALLATAGLATSPEEGAQEIARVLDDGRAAERMQRAMAAQGGDARVLEDRSRMPAASNRLVVESEKAGALRFVDVRKVGLAVAALGGGRRQPSDGIDMGVGLRFLLGGDRPVEVGDPIVEIHHEAGRGLDECRALLESAISIEASAAAPIELVRRRLD